MRPKSLASDADLKVSLSNVSAALQAIMSPQRLIRSGVVDIAKHGIGTYE